MRGAPLVVTPLTFEVTHRVSTPPTTPKSSRHSPPKLVANGGSALKSAIWRRGFDGAGRHRAAMLAFSAVVTQGAMNDAFGVGSQTFPYF